MRREVADRLITPVVAQPALHARVVHELCTGSSSTAVIAEPLQVLDGGRMRHSGVGAAQRLGDVGVQLREALDVDLVEDRVAPSAGQGRRSSPQLNSDATSTERGTYGAESLPSAPFGSSAA